MQWKNEVLPSESSRATHFQIDFDRVVRNIQELNALAGDGVAHIQHTMGGAHLKVH